MRPQIDGPLPPPRLPHGQGLADSRRLYSYRPNGVAFAARKTADHAIAAVGAKTAYFEPGSPLEKGYCEGFNGKLRDELLNSEVFYTLKEAKIVIEAWRRHYNTV